MVLNPVEWKQNISVGIDDNKGNPLIIAIESIKIKSMGNVSTGVLEKNKEQYARSKDKAEKKRWCIKTYMIAYVKI